MKIADQIKALRQSRGWSQGELAKRSGITQSMISRLENTSNEMMSIRTLMKLATALGAELKIELIINGLECALPTLQGNSAQETVLRGQYGIKQSVQGTKRLPRMKPERYWESHGIL